MLTYTLLLGATILGLLEFCGAAYTLKDDYGGANFFSMFDFFTENDPTSGYIDFISQSEGQSIGLVSSNGGQVYIGVDLTNVASGRGRKSIRLTSKAVYNHALIVLDLAHMPEGCGTWPAFWTVGPSWPSAGEIDIIEGVHNQGYNAMTLHTGPGCSILQSGSSFQGNAQVPHVGGFSGRLTTSNCDIKASGQAENKGCQIAAGQSNSYGTGLNANRGAVYATEWTSEAIRIWYFPRGSVPADVLGPSPSPASWGTPLASFASDSCDIDQHFKDHQIVFDTTFCGQWAGNVWSTDATCSVKAATCNDFVRNHPEAFQNAYWTINALKVYTGEPSRVPAGPGTGSQPSVQPAPTIVPSGLPGPPSPIVSGQAIASSSWAANIAQDGSSASQVGGALSGQPTFITRTLQSSPSLSYVTPNPVPPTTVTSPLGKAEHEDTWNGGETWVRGGGAWTSSADRGSWGVGWKRDQISAAT